MPSNLSASFMLEIEKGASLVYDTNEWYSVASSQITPVRAIILSELDKTSHSLLAEPRRSIIGRTGQVFDCALDPYIQDAQITFVRLHLELSSPLVDNNDDNIPRRRSRSVILELRW